MDFSGIKEKLKDTKVRVLVGGGIVVAGAWGSCTFQGGNSSAEAPAVEEAAPTPEEEPKGEPEAEAEAEAEAPPAE
jgi:hypothetical protein